MSNYNNYNNNSVMNSNNFEEERNLLRELLKQLNRHPYDMSWEELIFENEELSREFSTYIAQQKSIGKPIIEPIGNYKTVMCKNIKQGIVCPYGNNCKFSHSYQDIRPSKPSFLNHKAKEFIPSSNNGIIPLGNLPDILNTIDDLHKQSIDIVLAEIKECKEKLLIKDDIDTKVNDNIETRNNDATMDIVVEEEVGIEELTNKLFDSLNIVGQKEKEKDDMDIEDNKCEDDGTCRAKVAKTGERCTAPNKNGTLFCGRHKNYKGELML